VSRFALSTAWHIARITDARELLALPARLGFGGVELSSVGLDLAAEVREVAGDGYPPIVSLHAPCPVPYPGAARLDDLAALDERRRRAAVDFTKATVDMAAAVGARAIVLHLGTVEGTLPQPAVVQAMEDGMKVGMKVGMEAGDRDEWKALLAKGLAARKAVADRHLDRCMASLEALTAHAAGSGVRLGAETRYEYNDLPSFEEFAVILREFGHRGVGYWHDVGHAHAQQVLGLATPRQYLERYGENLLGFHLHDARSTRDHLPPGEGEVDFEALRAYARPEHLRVFEVFSVQPEERLDRSLRYLEELNL
jgi:sugar phosphate isomerase/epimerase